MPRKGNNDEWQTPVDKWVEYWVRWHYTVDAASTDENALVRPHGENCWSWKLGGEAREGQHCSIGVCNLGIKRDLNPIGRYYTQETNGLDPSHYHAGDVVWCNPPYSNPRPWVYLAAELAWDGGIPWTLCLPATTDVDWFKKRVWNERAQRWRDGVEGRFDGRWHFRDPAHPEKDSPRGPTLIVQFLAGGDK